MKNGLLQRAIKLNIQRKHRKGWQKAVSILSAGVVFCTTYALILPAITMEREAVCGLEAHTHDSSCYEQRVVYDLQCGLQLSRDITAVVHVHNELCYDADHQLRCTLEEKKEHTHTDACYEVKEIPCPLEESEGHVHGEACVPAEVSVPVCALEETQGHAHGEACYASALICTLPEGDAHIHEDACYEAQLNCTLPEAEGHTHGEACFTMQTVPCTVPEGEGHTHTDACVTQETVLVCTEEALKLHSHDESCYEEVGEEPDVELVLVCTEPVVIAHVHDEACLVETENAVEVLTCDQEEHEHEQACYPELDEVENVTAYICGMDAHIHEEDCYAADGTLLCTVPAHEHSADCVAADGSIADEAGGTENARMTLTAETDLVFAEATFDLGVLPEDAVMVVTALPETEESLLAMEQALTDGSVAVMYRFDITFTDAAGNELEPNGSVSVNIRFAEPLVAADAQSEQQIPMEWNLVHIPDEGGAENLTAEQSTVLETSENNGLTGVKFERDNFSEYILLGVTPDGQSGEISLEDYLKNNGGTVDYNLYDAAGKLITGIDAEVVVGEVYSFAFVVEAPKGIHPDDYFLQLPEGIIVTPIGGDLVTDGETIGTWTVDDAGFITLHFNETADGHQNILFSGSIDVVFNQVDESIVIDGDLVVKPREPNDESGYMWKSFYYSYLYNNQGEIVTDSNGNQVPKSINWRITIVGSDGDTPVVGQTITDRLGNSGQQIYDPDREPVSLEITLPSGEVHGDIVISTQENINAGIFKWITDESGNYVGWEYTVPETIACTGNNCASEKNDACEGDGSTELTLQDEDWRYYFRCESFPKDGDRFNPEEDYSNTAFKSDKPDWKYTVHTGEEVKPGVVKNAAYDAVSDEFDFDVTITIPGGIQGSYVTLVDDMTILNPDASNLHKTENTIDELKSVTMIIGEQEYSIPVLDFTKENEPSVARNEWFSAHQNYSATPYILVTDTFDIRDVNGTSVTYEYSFEFWKWCDCTEQTCMYGNCATQGQTRNGFCRCWDEQEAVTILFQYSTPADELIAQYGGQGLSLENDLELLWMSINPDDGKAWTQKVEDKPTVPIPGVIGKTELTKAASNNEYTAIFGITLNESQQDWSKLDEVVVHDEMSPSLVYIPGTLEITRGKETTPLTIGVDYTMEAVPGGHGFIVTILDPQQIEYHMQYSAMVVQEGIDISNPGYNNKAWVTIDDTKYTSGEINSSLQDFTFASKSYQVTVYKVDQNNAPLDGVVFGLFAENGELIQEKTVENGSVTFMTSVTDGIIFQTHSKYYIQELVPKPGYTPDYTKYMFYFCEKNDCTEETEGVVHFGNTGTLTVINSLGGYELPNTGGSGTILYSLGGLTLMLLAAYLLLNKHYGKEGNRVR